MDERRLTRTLILTALAAMLLASCAGAYDKRAREECARLPPREQMDCLDRLDEIRRERRD